MEPNCTKCVRLAASGKRRCVSRAGRPAFQRSEVQRRNKKPPVSRLRRTDYSIDPTQILDGVETPLFLRWGGDHVKHYDASRTERQKHTSDSHELGVGDGCGWI